MNAYKISIFIKYVQVKNNAIPDKCYITKYYLFVLRILHTLDLLLNISVTFWNLLGRYEKTFDRYTAFSEYILEYILLDWVNKTITTTIITICGAAEILNFFWLPEVLYDSLA